VCVDYVSKWVEAIHTRTNKSRVVIRLLRENIFARYGTPLATISDQGTHFDNRSFDTLLRRYSFIHCLPSPYHPQTNGQAEVSNRQIKQILEMTANKNRKESTDKLIDALWAYCTVFNTPTHATL